MVRAFRMKLLLYFFNLIFLLIEYYYDRLTLLKEQVKFYVNHHENIVLHDIK